MSAFCPFLIFVASFVNKNAYWQLGRFDYACGAFSVLALVLWALTANPLVAIFFAILADLAAGVPTLIKAWRYPQTETVIAYVLASIALTTSFVVAEPSLEAYAFPAYLITLNAAIIFGIVRGRRTTSV